MWALGANMVARLMDWWDDDDDKKEDLGLAGVYAEAIRRASPYKMSMDTMIPMGFRDPRTGDFRAIWTFNDPRDIPAHWEVVSARVPSSEEGRVWGALIYDMLANNTEELGKPGMGTIGTLSNWSTNNLLPGFNPILKRVVQVAMMLNGKNPDDSFTGGPVANPLLFDAGWGYGRGDAIVGSALEGVGPAGQAVGDILALTGVIDDRAVSRFSRRGSKDPVPLMERIPLAKGFVSYDNAAGWRQENLENLNEKTIRSRTRAFIPAESKEMYDYYYRNKGRKDKMDDYDYAKYIVAKEFVNKVWGKALNNNGDTLNTAWATVLKDGSISVDRPTLYGKMLWAVSNNASKGAIDSLQQEIQVAASPYYADFTNIKKLLDEGVFDRFLKERQKH